MRAALNALTDELKRLKSTGVKSVPVSEASLVALRKVISARSRVTAPAAAPEQRISAKPAAAESPASAPTPAAAPATAGVRPKPVAAAAPMVMPATPKLPPPPVVTLPAGTKAERWEALREQVLNHPVCKENVREGKRIVFGTGSLDAKIMFVGEAPGAEEEIEGVPFIGPAGQLLTRMIAGMGLKRDEVYIGNIMNWRPQIAIPAGGEQIGNRPPTPEELGFCLPFLRAQIEIVNPDLVVALGSTAAQGLLGADTFKSLGEIRGSWKEFAGKPVMVTYHPSYILRNGSNRSKRMIWEDLLKVMERAALPISEKQRGYFLDK